MSRLEKNALEWSVFAVALLLVLATVGYLVREALTTQVDAPPDLVVTLGQPTRTAGGHRVPVQVENRGGETAEQVQVTVSLEGSEGSEDAALMIPYLPRESRRSGWVTFQGDPGAGVLRVEGVAYQAP